MNRSWKSERRLESHSLMPPHQHRNGAGDTSLARLSKLFGSHLTGSLFFSSFLPLLFTISSLAFSPLAPFLHLSRIKTISVDQVKDYLGVSLKQHLCPSQEIYILRDCFRKLKILGAKGVGL